jgi:hypothetical protein
VAAFVLDTYCNFYLARKDNIANNSTTTEARDKNMHRLGILRIL